MDCSRRRDLGWQKVRQGKPEGRIVAEKAIWKGRVRRENKTFPLSCEREGEMAGEEE